MIEAGGTGRDKLGAVGGELLQHAAVDGIVHEDADGREPRASDTVSGPRSISK